MNQVEVVKSGSQEVSRTRIVKFENGKWSENVERRVVLLDISGSMCLVVDTRRKVDILREVMKKIGSGFETWCFSTNCVKTAYIPEPDGSTDLEKAFLAVGKGMSSLLLVSDGLPDEPISALQRAREIVCAVDVIYIGKPGDEGEAFMRCLAEETGGKYMTVDTMSTSNEFQEKLQQGVEKMLLE